MKYELQAQSGFDDINSFNDWWQWAYRIGWTFNVNGREPGLTHMVTFLVAFELGKLGLKKIVGLRWQTGKE